MPIHVHMCLSWKNEIVSLQNTLETAESGLYNEKHCPRDVHFCSKFPQKFVQHQPLSHVRRHVCTVGGQTVTNTLIRYVVNIARCQPRFNLICGMYVCTYSEDIQGFRVAIVMVKIYFDDYQIVCRMRMKVWRLWVCDQVTSVRWAHSTGKPSN